VGGSESINEAFGLKKSDNATQNAVEGVLGMVSPGGMAKAIIIPATAAGLGVKELRAANSLIKAGKAEEAYEAHKIYEDPVTGELLKVIPDTKASLNTKELNLGLVLPGSRAGAPAPVSVYMDPTKSAVTLDKLISHPELFASTPELATTTVGGKVKFQGVNQFPKIGEASTVLGVGGDPSRIGMGQTLSTSSRTGSAMGDFMSNLLHEIQHDVQWKYGMPIGGVPENFIDISRVKEAQNLLADRWASGQYATRYAQNTLDAALADAFSLYRNLPGEVQARLVEKQYQTGDYNTLPTVLMQQLGVDFNQMQRALTGPRVDADPVVQNLLNLYAPRAGANQ